MGTKEQMQNIGKRGTTRFGNMVVQVEITDYKVSYGKERWLVTPVAGSGDTWVETCPL